MVRVVRLVTMIVVPRVRLVIVRVVRDVPRATTIVGPRVPSGIVLAVRVVLTILSRQAERGVEAAALLARGYHPMDGPPSGAHGSRQRIT